MGNRKELVSSLQELREDNIRKQKRGLHFIVASVFIWVAVLGIHISSLPILSKNLFTFCCSTPLVPLAFLLSKILKIDFQNKENPLSGLGLLISLNQILIVYLNRAVPLILFDWRNRRPPSRGTRSDILFRTQCIFLR